MTSAPSTEPPTDPVRRPPGCPSAYQRIYAVVRKIPKGRVATYGQVATLAGLPGHARQVGYALSALDDARSVPWHRVINAQGRVSLRGFTGDDHEQQERLEREGVVFDDQGRVSLARYRWTPRASNRKLGA